MLESHYARAWRFCLGQVRGFLHSTRMPPDFLKTVLLPLALIVIMFGMGMGLTLADFKRVIFSPKAKLLGLACQLIALPLLAFALTWGFRLQDELAVGLMLIAACPGGPTSNIISHLARGDTALSVTLTAVSSLITIFTIPLIMSYSMNHFLAGETAIHLPILKTFGQLVVVTILPVALGMWVNAAKPGFSRRMAKPVNIASIVFLALIIVLAVIKEKDLGAQIAAAGPATVALNLVGMILSYGVARLFRLPIQQRVTLSIEVGIQNGTLALAIALMILESAKIAMPAVVYSLFMFFSGAFMIVWFGWKNGSNPPTRSNVTPLT